MLSRLLPVSILIFSAVTAQGMICNSIPECQDLKNQVETQIQVLSGKRVSNMGAIFTRVTSNPELGEAYQDPSGLVWGAPAFNDGQIAKMVQYDANTYCKKVGASLPSKEEIEQLLKYLGLGSPQGYSPYLADGKTEVIPALANRFWGSTLAVGYTVDMFNGATGGMGTGFILRGGNEFSVRCVARP